MSSTPSPLLQEEELVSTLSSILLTDDDDDDDDAVEGLDEDLVAYLSGLLSEGFDTYDDVPETEDGIKERVTELIGPFLESVDCPEDRKDAAIEAVLSLATSNQHKQQQQQQKSSSSMSMSKKSTSSMKLKQVRSMKESMDEDDDTAAFLWNSANGQAVKANSNTAMVAHYSKESAKDRRKARQELEKSRREYEAKLRQAEAEEDNDANNVSAMVLPNYQSTTKGERDINVRNITLSLDNGRLLLDNGEIKLAYKRRYGLVGKNGVGKTTLLKAMASLELDGWPQHLRVLHVRQEIKTAGNETSVLQAVMDSDVERLALVQEEKELVARLEAAEDNADEGTAAAGGGQQEESTADRRKRLLAKKRGDGNNNANNEDESFQQDLARLDHVYARLQVLGSDSAEARARRILSGLQFTEAMQLGPTSALSGGWRMRVSLAAALFIEPDLLLLDEPTNHIDLEAVLWLESYLIEYKHTLMVVSHDRGFLNAVTTDTMEFAKRQLTYYRGNYDTYMKTSDEQTKNAMRQYQAYHDKRAHMMEFIEKFRANAKRATMVQSRIKAVEKMDAEAPEPVEIEPIWRFSIPNPEPLGRPIISVDDVTFDYGVRDGVTPNKPLTEYLLQECNFGVDLTSRIGILGANGAGKSTLLNLIMGRLDPLRGGVTINGRLRIGHFTQHSADKFDLQLSAVENMLNLFEGSQDQEMRSFLGRFQIQGSDALKPMMLLSGGQKSRVAFASLAYQKPHVIAMDEPTNHLDLESIDALVAAIQDFKGGLIVISHDQFFITNTCSELWVVGDGKATRFRGDFEEYKKYTLDRTRKRVEASVKSLSAINN